MSAATVRKIVEAYIAHGGAKMDESHYQAYRLALLSKWLERSELFDTDGEYVCRECSGRLAEIDDAINHLQAHYPQLFHGQ